MILKYCNKCKTTKSIELFSKCTTRKCGVQSTCKECVAAAGEIRRFKKYGVKRAPYSIEEAKERNRKTREVYRLNNKERVKEAHKKSSILHKDTMTRNLAKRRATKLKAAKDWGELNQLIIEEAYKLSRLRSDLTGIDWHVDHIIPLQGKKVCGLHVGINLQVITAKENYSKNNKFEVS